MTGARPEASGALRISYLFSQFPVPTEVFAVSDIDALRQQGHHVIVHTMKPGRPDEPARLSMCGVPDDLQICRPSRRGALHWPATVWRYRKALRPILRRILGAAPVSPRTSLTAFLSIPRALEIVAEVEANDSDVVHLFWSRHAAMALMTLKLQGSAKLRSAFVGAYDLVADDFLVDIALESAQLVFSHAETNRAYVEARLRSDVPLHIVHRGIPLLPLSAERRDPNRWVTASALVREKNVDAVVRLFAAVRGNAPHLRLHIFGQGPDGTRLAAVAHELGCAGAVEFHGHVQRHDLFREMEKSAVFLLFSNKESERLPNVIKEAMWAGCFVMSSRSEGIDELIADPSFGAILDPAAADAALSAVQRLSNESQGEGEERRRKARALIAERFSAERNMRRYVDAWSAELRKGRQ